MAVTKSRHHEAAFRVDPLCFGRGSRGGENRAPPLALPKLRDDTVFDDQVSILDALHSVHLRALKLPHICRQYARQRSYVIYYGLHFSVYFCN